MSQILKQEEENNAGGDNDEQEEVDFTIEEPDVLETFKTFVKGMSKQEKQRFLGIYAKYQDKGQVKASDLKNQK